MKQFIFDIYQVTIAFPISLLYRSFLVLSKFLYKRCCIISKFLYKSFLVLSKFIYKKCCMLLRLIWKGISSVLDFIIYVLVKNPFSLLFWNIWIFIFWAIVNFLKIREGFHLLKKTNEKLETATVKMKILTRTNSTYIKPQVAIDAEILLALVSQELKTSPFYREEILLAIESLSIKPFISARDAKKLLAGLLDDQELNKIEYTIRELDKLATKEK